MSYNPLIVEYNYKREATFNHQYVGYANDIYLTQNKFVRDAYVAAGSKDEKNEYWGSYGFVPLEIRFRYKYNIINAGKNNLFQNVAVSPLFGIAMNFYLRESFFRDIDNGTSNGYIQVYGGSAIGTRKKIIDDFSYIEFFVSPQISLTYYGRLGGGYDTDLTDFLAPDRDRNFSLTMCDFTIPIGVGFKHRLLFIKSGIAISTTLGGETRKISGGNLIVDSYNFPQIPFFAEIGFHFRKFKSLEKELKNSKEI
jgi:hypothetical protein